MVMNSRYMGYPLLLKCTAIIPSFVAVAFFVTVISLYGRFPEDQVRFYVQIFVLKVSLWLIKGYPKFTFNLWVEGYTVVNYIFSGNERRVVKVT